MSNSNQGDQLPSNIVFYPEAAEDFRRLDRSRKIKVLKALRKISTAPLGFGKPLGNHSGRPLAGMRSMYVDGKSVRIIWIVNETGDIQVVVVAGIAERDGMHVYELVSSRRESIEKFTQWKSGSDVSRLRE